MIKLPASVAALFILTVAAIPPARACDEYCGEAQEAAYERAYEQQSAREEAAEEGYYGSQGRGSQSGSRRGRSARSAAPAQRQAAEPERKSDTPSRTRSRQDRDQDYDVANENSSIAGGSDEVASDDSFERRPVKSSGERRSGKAVGCKTYFPSVGMTLSVPCD